MHRLVGVIFAVVMIAACSLAAAQPAPARIGWISFNTAEASQSFLEALLQGFGDLGYVEGRNLTLLRRYADDNTERVAPLARKLVLEKPQVIIASGAATPDTLATVREIPVVYAFSGDPVAAGFAASLSWPREGTTGITWLSIELNGKRIELLKEAFPAMRRLAIIANPHHPGEHLEIAESRRAAAALGLELAYYPVHNVDELEAALLRLDAEGGADAIIALPDLLLVGQRVRLVEFGAARRIPVVSGWARMARSGALLTYGPNLPASLRRLTDSVHRSLTGTRPSSLPIEQPSSFELVVNIKTARRLQIELPPALIARADEIIE